MGLGKATTVKTWRLAALSLVILLPACASEPSEQDRYESQDMLFLQTGAGIAIAPAGASSAEFQAPGAIPSADWSTVVRSKSRRGFTRVVAKDALSGTETWRSRAQGSLNLKIVSKDGGLAALGPTSEKPSSIGRGKTVLTILGSTGSEKIIELDGNYEPEAFSSDGENLFVVQYLPARAPTKYRVRNLDLESGKVVGVYTVDAELQESMRGTARVQATSLDGSRLYTLYTLRSQGEARSFVHVLDLDEKWAHCIDLPAGFERSPEIATSMTVSPEGDRLFIGNSESGSIAEVDTEALTVTRSSQVSYGLGGPESMTMSRDHLFIASGRRLSAISLASFEEERSWSMKKRIKGLQVAADGYRLYVGQPASIELLDIETGERLKTFDPPGVDKINILGRTSPQPLEARANYVCAC